jgi:predicted Zn-dependent protease
MKLFLLLLLVTLNVTAQTKTEGVDVRKSSFLLLPASTVERSAGQQYGQLMRAAQQKNALNRDPEQVERLRRIARELIPHATRFNPNATKWQWEVNLISSKTVNAFCMPGGKIAFFTGILDTLQLTDDEVASIMLNLGQVSTEALAQAANLAVSLPYARSQETDADLVGLELAARAGHDPRAAVSVWKKMSALSQKSGKGQPPQFLSTHPANETRIRQIEANLPKVLPLYRK